MVSFHSDVDETVTGQCHESRYDMRVVHKEDVTEFFVLLDLSRMNDHPICRNHYKVEKKRRLKANMNCCEHSSLLINFRITRCYDEKSYQNDSRYDGPVWEISKLAEELFPAPEVRKRNLDYYHYSEQQELGSSNTRATISVNRYVLVDVFVFPVC